MPRVKRTVQKTTVEELPGEVGVVEREEGEVDEAEVTEEHPPESVEGVDPFEWIQSCPDEYWREKEVKVYVYQIEPPITKRLDGEPAYMLKTKDRVTEEMVKARLKKADNYVMRIWVKEKDKTRRQGDRTICRKDVPFIVTEDDITAVSKTTGLEGLIEKLVGKATEVKSGTLAPDMAVKQAMEMMGATYSTLLQSAAEGSRPNELLGIITKVMEMGNKESPMVAVLLDKLLTHKESPINEKILDALVTKALNPPRVQRVDEEGPNEIERLDTTIQLLDRLEARAGSHKGGGGSSGGWASFFAAIAPQLPQLATGLVGLISLASRRLMAPPMTATQAPGVTGTSVPPQFIDPNAPGPIPAELLAPTLIPPPDPGAQLAAEVGEMNRRILIMYAAGRGGDALASMIQDFFPGIYAAMKLATAEQIVQTVKDDPQLGPIIGADAALPDVAREMVDYFKTDGEGEEEGEGKAA
jgi:hypothetical protein